MKIYWNGTESYKLPAIYSAGTTRLTLLFSHWPKARRVVCVVLSVKLASTSIMEENIILKCMYVCMHNVCIFKCIKTLNTIEK